MPSDPFGEEGAIDMIARHYHESYIAFRKAGFGHPSALYLCAVQNSLNNLAPPNDMDATEDE